MQQKVPQQCTIASKYGLWATTVRCEMCRTFDVQATCESLEKHGWHKSQFILAMFYINDVN